MGDLGRVWMRVNENLRDSSAGEQRDTEAAHRIWDLGHGGLAASGVLPCFCTGSCCSELPRTQATHFLEHSTFSCTKRRSKRVKN